MTMDRIVSEIDAEIARLQRVRVLLSTTVTRDAAQPARKRRKLSAAARKKIAAAQKARWAKKKAAAK